MRTRRRLLLERAAYQLTREPTSVTEIGFDAGNPWARTSIVANL